MKEKTGTTCQRNTWPNDMNTKNPRKPKESKSSLLELPIFLFNSTIAADAGVAHANLLNTGISPQAPSPSGNLWNVGKGGKER
jgi:hypothetical protein